MRRVWFVRALAQLLIVVAIVFAVAAAAALLLAIVSSGEFADGLRIMALLIGALAFRKSSDRIPFYI